jgi:hypothetical protein
MKSDPGAHATESSNPAPNVTPFGILEKTLTERHYGIAGLFFRLRAAQARRFCSGWYASPALNLSRRSLTVVSAPSVASCQTTAIARSHRSGIDTVDSLRRSVERGMFLCLFSRFD